MVVSHGNQHRDLRHDALRKSELRIPKSEGMLKHQTELNDSQII